jgi:nucleoside-diphosphate-sugar epimerase
MPLTTILGAGGPISNELVKILSARGAPIRLVSRSARPTPGAEVVSADISDQDQAIRAVAGSSVVHLLVGLKYGVKVWHEQWPRIMASTIEACKLTGARLIFFDNVYMYGLAAGPMTEELPYAPVSKKRGNPGPHRKRADGRGQGGKADRHDCALCRFLRPRRGTWPAQCPRV